MKRVNKILSGLMAVALFATVGTPAILAGADDSTEYETVETFYDGTNTTDQTGNNKGILTGYTRATNSCLNTTGDTGTIDDVSSPYNINIKSPGVVGTEYHTCIVKSSANEFIDQITEENIGEYAIQFDMYNNAKDGIKSFKIGLSCSIEGNKETWDATNYAINYAEIDLSSEYSAIQQWYKGVTVPLTNLTFAKCATELDKFNYAQVCGVGFLLKFSNTAGRMYFDNIKLVKKVEQETPPEEPDESETADMSPLANSTVRNDDGTTYNTAFTTDSVKLSSYKSIVLYNGDTKLGGFSLLKALGTDPANYDGDVKLGVQINNIKDEYSNISVKLSSIEID